MSTYLNSNNDELSLEKQHQFFGAINEIDSMIQLLADYRHKEIHDEKYPDDVFFVKTYP